MAEGVTIAITGPKPAWAWTWIKYFRLNPFRIKMFIDGAVAPDAWPEKVTTIEAAPGKHSITLCRPVATFMNSTLELIAPPGGVVELEIDNFALWVLLRPVLRPKNEAGRSAIQPR